MHQKHQLRRFKRIQSHYQRELDELSAKLASLNQTVARARQALEQAEKQLRQTEQGLMSSQAVVINRELGTQLLKKLTGDREQRKQQLAEASESFAVQRSRAESQLAKIDSLERLVQKKSELVAYHQQRNDQLLSDEQFLRSSFSRDKQ